MKRREPQAVPGAKVTFYTRAQACTLLGIGIAAYMTLVRDKRVKELRLSKTTVRVPSTEIDRLAAEAN